MAEVTIQKQQLQNSNNAQTKLHTMFEDMIHDLEETKRTLSLTANCLSDSQAALSAAHEELATVKDKLDATTNELSLSKFDSGKYSEWFSEEFDGHAKSRKLVKTQKKRIEQLESELAHKKEKVKMNADSEKQLSQLKKQWSSLSNVLGDN